MSECGFCEEKSLARDCFLVTHDPNVEDCALTKVYHQLPGVRRIADRLRGLSGGKLSDVFNQHIMPLLRVPLIFSLRDANNLD